MSQADDFIKRMDAHIAKTKRFIADANRRFVEPYQREKARLKAKAQREFRAGLIERYRNMPTEELAQFVRKTIIDSIEETEQIN